MILYDSLDFFFFTYSANKFSFCGQLQEQSGSKVDLKPDRKKVLIIGTGDFQLFIWPWKYSILWNISRYPVWGFHWVMEYPGVSCHSSEVESPMWFYSIVFKQWTSVYSSMKELEIINLLVQDLL